jgi:hypothetical protein
MTYDEQRGAARERRACPLPAVSTPVTPHRTPVPLPAHPSYRAIRVLRSPR